METLVAITLLLLAIGGPMYAVSQSLSSAIYARDQITAFYLAQDAVEYMRNYRDNNALANPPVDWLQGLNTVSYLPADGSPGAPFNIDSKNATITDCNTTCGAMSYDPTTGLYGYGPGSAGTASPYTRTMTLQKVDKNQIPPNEVRLKVDISWRSNIAGARQDFTVVENLTSWVQ